MSVMLGSDRLQHMLWRHFDKTHRRFIEGSEFANVIKDYYIYLDKKLGEIINLLPPDVTIIVCSDHGMIKQEGKININNWLIQEGYLVVKKNVDLSQKVRFKLEFVDLEKSVAWGSGAYNGRIFINKEKLGIKWEQLRDEIAQKITRIPDDKGNPLDTKAFKAEEIYNDLSRPQCPDLTIYFDNLRWASNPDLGQQGLYSWHTAVGADNAGHSTQGLCIIHAPDVAKKGEMPDIDIRQIAPTILQRMQVPIPKDIQIPALEVFN
jgi:predicted AlkP superfamily phosphohydrolase/phosphomutase